MSGQIIKALTIAVGGLSSVDDISMALIKSVVADFYRVTVAQLEGRDRSRAMREPRHVATYLCYAMTPRSYGEIGIAFGRRDCSTIRHSVAKGREVNQAVVDALWRAVRERAGLDHV